MDHGRLNVLTVARFGREKGILRALHAVAALGALRGGLRYYLIGDGLEYAEAQKTERVALGEVVTSLGGGLKDLAACNLTRPLGKQFAESYEPLRHDFNSALETLSGTIVQVIDLVVAFSIGVLLLTLLDLFIIAITVREWRHGRMLHDVLRARMPWLMRRRPGRAVA